MRVAVLSSPQSWYVRDLQRAGEDSFSVVALPFTCISSQVDNDGTRITAGGTRLDQFDAVIVRTMPPGSLEQVVFRMDALQQLHARGVLVVNSPKSIEVAVDKYLALAKLQAAGIRVPKTETSQTMEEAMASFQRLGGDVVLKPLFGSEGRGITRINDEAIAERTFKLLIQLGAVVYQQEFIAHNGSDLRLLVLGEEVVAMRRTNKRDWRCNISRGATADAIEVPDEARQLALHATATIGAMMAGVDFLPTRGGELVAIEINAVPGWRAIGKVTKLDIARKVLMLLKQKTALG